MRTTRWVMFAAPLAALLGTAGDFRLRADDATDRAIRVVEEGGGAVTRDETRIDRPVVAVSLCGATLTDAVLRELASFPQLRSLDLCRTQGLTAKRIKYVADLKTLESLTLARNPRVTGHWLYPLAALKNVRTLDLSHMPDLDDGGLEAVADFFPNLTTLDISGSKNVTAAGLLELRRLRHLDTLRAAGSDYTDAEVKAISLLTGLKSLSVGGSPRVSTMGLKAVAALANLESLDVSGMPAVTSASLYSFRGLTKLTSLNVADCPRMANHSLKVLATLKGLRTLNLSGCRQLEDYGLEYLVKTLPDLESLDLSGCDDIHDAGVKHLTNLTRLHTLNLRRCPNVSAAAEKALSDALPELRIER